MMYHNFNTVYKDDEYSSLESITSKKRLNIATSDKEILSAILDLLEGMITAESENKNFDRLLELLEYRKNFLDAYNIFCNKTVETTKYEREVASHV